MAADRTSLFKSTVKAVRLTSDLDPILPKSSTRLLQGSAHDKTFGKLSHTILQNICRLRTFLHNKHEEYLQISSTPNAANELRSEEIDNEIEQGIRLCQEGLKKLRSDHISSQQAEQVRQHRQAVVDLLHKYLRNITKVYGEQLNVRRKRAALQKQIAGRSLDDGVRQRLMAPRNGTNLPDISSTSVEREGSRATGDNEELTKEEMQIFELENDSLLDELNGMMNEVKSLESKVTEISRLQGVFTEQVVKQEKDIDRIAETAVTTTENVKVGNEQVRDAMRNQSTFRFWILFFVIVLTLTLIFLDWYNE